MFEENNKTTTMAPEHAVNNQDLDYLGLRNSEEVYRNPTPPELYEHIIKNGEGILTADYAIRILTGKYTGRSPKDRFIVDTPSVRDKVDWNDINQPIDGDSFDRLYQKMTNYMNETPFYVMDVFAGADKEHRVSIRVISETAYHALFTYNAFINPTDEELENFEPEYTIIASPNVTANPEEDNTRTETFILLNLDRMIQLIGGSMYSGEVKKGVFTTLNYLYPGKSIMPMHCSANIDKNNNTGIYFGLSGTGKTTLSADSSKTLIGDDEHGWTDEGVFNFEGGCYAKTIELSPEGEPEIYATTKRPGTILENVVLDEQRRPDFDDDHYTQNTRASYPLEYIPNASETGVGPHPTHVVFLTADAFGIFPPISRLTTEQAMYHFISGYTAKLAGTERGVDSPQATFSACFGAPFMPKHPAVYAELLAYKIREHGSKVWLMNTGWTGGPYGEGHRIELEYTRTMLSEALANNLDDVEYVTEPVFGLQIPKSVDGVPDKVLQPRDTWSDPKAYDEKAGELAQMFHDNFKKFQDEADESILNAGPRL